MIHGRFSARFAIAAIAVILLSGCAVEYCGPDYPFDTSVCSKPGASFVPPR